MILHEVIRITKKLFNLHLYAYEFFLLRFVLRP